MNFKTVLTNILAQLLYSELLDQEHLGPSVQPLALHESFPSEMSKHVTGYSVILGSLLMGLFFRRFRLYRNFFLLPREGMLRKHPTLQLPSDM